MLDQSVLKIYFSHFALKMSLASRIKLLFNLYGVRIKKRLLPRSPVSLQLLGPFTSYAEALDSSSGYASPLILAKVQQAVVEVLECRAAYERDGTAFPSRPQVLKIRDLLLKLLTPTAHVVDFGGGLGGVFINHLDLVSPGQQWEVIEQPSFIATGQLLADRYGLPIRFLSSLAEIVRPVDLLILSSVLQYLTSPYDVLNQVRELAPRNILIDRTAFIKDREECWWVQDCRDHFGPFVSIPIQPLSLDKLLEGLRDFYVVDKWVNSFDPSSPRHLGLLLRKN